MTVFRVEVSAFVAEKAAFRYGEERSEGRPSEYDFVTGPLAAALRSFGGFDALPIAAGPAVRISIIVDPFFGAVVFTGVLLAGNVIEIADFDDDPDYWVTSQGETE